MAEIVIGNLTGNGRNEAAVVATYRGASSDYYETSVYLYTMRGHRLKLIAILNEESIRRQYERFTHDDNSTLFEAVAGGTKIAHRRLVVRHVVGDAHCCPGNVVTIRYRLKNRKLIADRMLLGKRRKRDERLPLSCDDT